MSYYIPAIYVKITCPLLIHALNSPVADVAAVNLGKQKRPPPVHTGRMLSLTSPHTVRLLLCGAINTPNGSAPP